MMKNFKYIIGCIALSGMLMLGSCAKEDEPLPEDPSNPSGDARDKFNGLWSNAEESKDYGAATYNVNIADSSNSTHVQISYLYGFNTKIYATVSGNNMTIPSQIVEGNGVSGTAVLANPSTINMTYYVQTTVTHFDTITAVLTK